MAMTSDLSPFSASPKAASMGVLFADVAGSTKLYDTLGDTQAKGLIDECIVVLRAVVLQHHGRVIKTIGDEVMCVIPDADNACLAAMDMQLRVTALPALAGVKRAIRIGWNFGPVIEENGDVFGDTVNLAARMASLAKAMQIITTRATVEQLPALLRTSARQIAALAIKGKGDDVPVCEIIWQDSDELTMTTPSIMTAPRSAHVQLHLGDADMQLSRPGDSVLIGRDGACALVVNDRMASRQHARIDVRQGKIVLIDQSTNGTYVVFADEPEITLRREEVMLRGHGRIAFGRSTVGPLTDTVEFTVSD